MADAARGARGARAPLVACVGEPLVEIAQANLGRGTARLGVAGDVLNTAIYLARLLGAEARVEMVTVLGRDDLSQGMLAAMAAEGVGTSRVGRHPDRLPGLYAIELDAGGERGFRYWREASAARTLFAEGPGPAELLGDADVVYLSAITLAVLEPGARAALAALCGALKGQGRRVVFDGNHRPRLWRDAAEARAATEAMWRAATLGLPSADDEAALWGDGSAEATARRLAALGVAEVAVKRGARGPLLLAADGLRDEAFPPAPRVVDTTAAGDSFNAGYLAARLRGAGPAEAAREGHALACRVIGARGAILPR